ncbi:helix-turn-helix domain-containing protein [Mycobacteroides abscessus]|uniref:DNA binding domain, excisionase family n=1 Tax=Mycobacteroides abscessus subsp. massiliense TaxID=1962118 RepID=A0A1T8PAS0_9MYCO|nr:helix-turn-helix domain-containing protein [Mycobacteroides abscessus]SKM28585.1 DNA binding domain, excisionase family [Mycobacteroides abscessus subsp. massiliense]SKT31791.1 DNA binding domain, excisionase family [Mycobacteroides abscessus subsp. massiliense]SKT69010.1 DNA binding domain, excisionase family [Mycobacteroides abscessus subsp. massiliense]SKX08833.1 DNA binding domain, excisionase family [Mycobacteroides abscessus subsp. massiliense]
MPTFAPGVDLTVAQIAGQTGIPKRTVIAAIARGDLKARKLPGTTGAYLVKPRDLDKYLTNRTATATVR